MNSPARYRVVILASSCKGRSNTIEANRFKLIQNKKRVGSRQQRVVFVGGEFHSTDGFAEGAGRGLAQQCMVQGEQGKAGRREARGRWEEKAEARGEVEKEISACHEVGCSAEDTGKDKENTPKGSIL